MADRPVVGVSFAGEEWGYAEKECCYLEALRRAGAEPLPVRPGAERDVPGLLRQVQGWVFTGGDDISPEYYGETPHPRLEQVNPPRDRMDLLLARSLLAEGMPCLGICLGVQLLNIAAGGSLLQDIPSMVEGAVAHSAGARHRVRIEGGTRLASICGEGEFEVNSYHHQGIKRLGRGFRVVARSPDGVVEAIERPGDPFVLGVQWHPERAGCAAPTAAGLFAAFVEAVKERNPLPLRNGS